MVKRSIPLYIILSIVTCGLFSIYWIYTVANDMYNLGDNMPTTPVLTVVLFYVTCGIYGIFTMYKWGKATPAIMEAKGFPGEDKAILYVILSIFGLHIVNMALIQSDLNQLAA